MRFIVFWATAHALLLKVLIAAERAYQCLVPLFNIVLGSRFFVNSNFNPDRLADSDVVPSAWPYGDKALLHIGNLPWNHTCSSLQGVRTTPRSALA